MTESLNDAAVLSVNTEFYQALESGELETMAALWAHRDDTVCVHPGHRRLTGWPAVRSSWETIFSAGGNPQVIVTDEQVVRHGSVAWVTNTENMLSRSGTAVATALNVFHHDGDRWLMVAHHASPVVGR